MSWDILVEQDPEVSVKEILKYLVHYLQDLVLLTSFYTPRATPLDERRCYIDWIFKTFPTCYSYYLGVNKEQNVLLDFLLKIRISGIKMPHGKGEIFSEE